MLSSDDKRFQWAKKDRAREPTLFRQFLDQWHPAIQLEPPPHSSKHLRPPRPTSVWTPWQWVK